jgi:hypothetical protein
MINLSNREINYIVSNTDWLRYQDELHPRYKKESDELYNCLMDQFYNSKFGPDKGDWYELLDRLELIFT